MRICEANTRILRAMPQPDIDAMRIGRLAPASTHQRNPKPAENRTLRRARALGKRRGSAGWMRFPNGRPTESVSQIIGSEWDAFSGWIVGGKFIPESALRTGHAFPPAVQAESTSRNRPSERDVLSASRVLNTKTYAPSIPKLGRRKPKRYRRRSI